MGKTEKRTVSLSAEEAAFVDAEVASGRYASDSEVVREGLRVLKEREAEIDRWIAEEVMPAYEEWKAGDMRTYTTEEVFAAVHASIRERAARKAS